MKKYYKKPLSVLLVLLLLTTPIFAAKNDGYFTSDFNRQDYTPRICQIVISENNVYFENMQWDDYSFGAALYWEGEIRRVSEGEFADVYSGLIAGTSNLPFFHKEYDEDDVTVGCHGMSEIKGNTLYYAGLTVEKGPKYDQGIDLVFESETGIWGICDGLPTNYQTFGTYLNTVRRTAIAWVCEPYNFVRMNVHPMMDFASKNSEQEAPKDEIKVLVGDIAKQYLKDGKTYESDSLFDVGKTKPNEMIPVLITFSQYLNVDDASLMLSEIDCIDTVYIWTPGKTGRSIINVRNNNLRQSIKSFFDTIDISNMENLEMKNDLQELINNYGVFAVEVKASARQLQSLLENTQVNSVNPIFSSEAYEASVATSNSISYICIPQKPDGAM